VTGRERGQLSIIEVHGLTKRYGQLVAVDHVSFGVARGETFGLLGPNGAGKTTTVRMLTGVIEADEGKALISGHRAGSLKAKQMAGVVPEMANAYADLSGWNNLMLVARLYGIPDEEARQRSSALLEEMDLLPRKDDPVKAYSKGMKQRLILCMALVSDPELLFLDEPTSGLDVQSSRLMKDMLRRLNTQGKTIFLTTHNMDEASQLCDRVAIINKGKMVAIDAPERLRTAISGRNSVEVSFNDSVSPEELRQLPGVNEVQKVGDRYRLFTDSPSDLVVALVNHSSTLGLKIVTMNILAPSLEDAFVMLTEKETGHA
jgi:ABC-2 type transport system ATP-binding protein